MEWQKATEKEKNVFEIPARWLLIHYYEALTILFRIENALRIFVFAVLKNELQDKWADINITSDDSEEGTIKSIAKKRINQASSYGYLGFDITCSVMHLTSGELIRLITSNSYWKYFNKFFLGSKEIIKNKLDEIGNIRNSIAHFRPIKEDDVDVVKQNAKHVLAKIEESIFEMTSCKNIVPTNTVDDWYKDLKTIGTENCILSFNQSSDEQWVKIKLEYNCSVISQRKLLSGRMINYKVLNLISSAILKQSPTLSKFIIFMSEYMPRSMTDQESDIEFKKDIFFLFSRKTLSEYYKDIKTEFEKILLTISGEIELIKQDNLAKGKLVEMVSAKATLEKVDGFKYWDLDMKEFKTPISEDDPAEFWGNFSGFDKDFISITESYPWMPVSISKYEVPF